MGGSLLLSRLNEKIGDGAWSWSIPAVKTCPGSTPTCRSKCYARTHRFRFNSVKNRLARNLEFARRPDFWAIMVGTIRENGVQTLRIHSSGDWFSPAYVDQWAKIAKMCPDVTMWGYTRSWRKPAIRRSLAKLARAPNLTLYYSCDRDTGLPVNLPAGVRTAWLQVEEDDLPAAPVDLVFRSRNIRSIVAKTVATPGKKSMVCPTETGLPDAHDHHCSTCQVCFTPDTTSEHRSGRVPLSVLR